MSPLLFINLKNKKKNMNKKDSKPKKKRSCMTMGKEEIAKMKVILRPVALSPEEDKARIKRLCRLIFPHKKL